jgi:hypothetical protein
MVIHKTNRKEKLKMKKFVIKMMTDRTEGYKTAYCCETIEETYELLKALKVYYNPIDIYYKNV